MDRDNEQWINLSKNEIKELIKNLEPGTMLTLEIPEIIGEDKQGKREVSKRWQNNMS